MAVDILYDNGKPTGANAIAGEGGTLLNVTVVDSNTATVTYEAGDTVVFTPDLGDIALLFNPDDNSDFCVMFVTGPYMGPFVGDFPVTFRGDYDNNIYTLSPSTQTVVRIYSTSLYSSLKQGVANTYKIVAEIQKSHYSDLMIAYQKRINYSVTIDNLRRAFWGGVKDALYADTLFLVDNCQSPAKAYKVSTNSNTFEVFNNKFKNNITLDIAV
jgi:hypothetical protein